MIVAGSKVIDVPRYREVWVHGYKVWPESDEGDIISCFARGYWVNSDPWTESLGWKNNI